VIDFVSDKLTILIKQNSTDISEEKEEVINYGLKIAIYEIGVVLIIITLSILLGLFKSMFLFFVVFSSLRFTAGGSHARSRVECFLTYTIAMAGNVYLSKYMWAESFIPAIGVFLINFLVILKYAPGDSTEKPILSKKMKKRLKTSSLILTGLFLSLSLIIWQYDKICYNTILIASFIVTVLLSPLGYKIFRCKRSDCP
jgi:accessory gene regulator B